ncbi:MAG: hypothetical protein HYT77_02770 [Deltaproteobacteria bacterium]|nr:hypothetical protein [Deltaproteobacteria bacterium]
MKRSQQIKVDIQMVDGDGNPLPPNAKIKELSPGIAAKRHERGENGRKNQVQQCRR